ncbi:hypothetical protein GGI04_002465 [Coemansia thaxteri]|nr:hypothetical protein GGI04_002465 [Coemansia thaxteri]
MMTFIGDIESLLPASTTSESCQQKSNSGADLATTLLLESVFGTDTLPPKPAQHHEAQDTVACLNSNGEYKKCGKADHADNKSNLISIHYSEKEKRERKYECQHCKKRFTRPSSLTSHVYTHTGERPFACEFLGCTKRFSVLSNLRRHYKVHASRRSYGGGGDRGGGSRLPSTSLYSGTLFGSALADRAGFAFGAELNGTMSSASSRNPFATPLAHSATRSLYNSGQVLPDRQAYIPSTGSQLGLGSAVMPADFSSYGASMASGVNNFLGSNNGDMATSSLLGSLAEFKGGDGRSNDKDPVWRLLQAGYNMQ